VYSPVTCKACEIIVEENTVSALAVDNFETRVVQQLSEFFSRIWWVLVWRYELMGILKRWKNEINLLKTKRSWHYKRSVRASVIKINRWMLYKNKCRCLLWEPYGTHKYTVWTKCIVS